MADPLAPLRIGGVPYGVGAPLLTGLDDDRTVELVRAVPSDLIGSLRAGTIDAALVSSIEAYRRPGYAALQGVGICCRGEVKSVRAFRRRAASRIRSVALTRESEASVALLRILLAGPLEAAPDCTFERIDSTRSPGPLPHDLVLLIGDDGLRADGGDRDVIDLGAAWQAWTGLPFVFALWLIRPGADAPRVARVLWAARERARALPRTDREGGVHYDLDAAEHAGLWRYRTEAVRLGLAEPGIEPVFVTG